MNILVIRLRYLGDVLLGSSVCEPLRVHYPDAHIAMLVNSGTEDMVKCNPYIDEVISLQRSGWLSNLRFYREIRSRRFDCVIDLTDADRSAFISAWSGAPIRVGFNHEYRWRGKCYTHCLEGAYGTMHMVDYHAKALEPFGIHEPGGNPELSVSEEDERAATRIIDSLGLAESKWVMIHPAARYWFKAWPADRFAELADALWDQGYRVVMIGTENERETAETVLNAAKSPILSLIGQTKLLEMAALLKKSALFIGNDAGPMHMAASVGCPVVALFGPTDPAVWGPRGQKSTVIYKGLNCAGCFHPGCFRGEESCMKLISVEEVLQAARAILS